MSRISKRIVSLVLVIFLTLPLTGCWDSRELEEQAFVMAMGVDQAENGLLLFTFQLAVPKGMPGTAATGTEKEGSFTNISVKAATLFAAINILNSCIDRTINLTHTKLYIVGEKMAKNDPYPFRAFTRYREVRQDIYIMVAKGTAKEILEAFAPIPKTTPAKFIEVLIKNTGSTGLVPTTQLADYISRLESNSGEPLLMLIGKSHGLTNPPKNKVFSTAPYVPGQIPRSGGNPVEVIGAAIFKHSKMVGTFTGSENRVRELITGEFRHGFINFPDPEQPGRFLAIELKQNSAPKIKVAFHGDIPTININVVLEGDLAIEQGAVDYTRPDRLKVLEQYTNNDLEKILRNTIKKGQDMGSDVFGLGDVARHNFATWEEWNNVHWNDKFSKAKIVVHVDFSIRRIGLRFEQAKPVS